MTPTKFALLRKKIGSQEEVAKKLQLGARTLRRYEATKIPKWLEYAMKYLVEK